MKNQFIAVLLIAAVCGFVGCSAEAKRARHEKRAEDYFRKGEYIKAEIEYRNVARLSDTLPPKLVARLATIYYEQGRLLESFSLLTNAVGLNPDDVELRTKLGMVWGTFRQFSQARSEALFVLGKQPGHKEAILLLADAAQRPEDIPPVRQKVTEIQRTSGETWATHLALAALALRDKQTNVAEQELQLAARLDAKAPDVNVALAQLASFRGQSQEAEKYLRIAAENSPQRSTKRLLVAQHFMEKTNMAEAKNLLDKQIKEAPDYVPAWVARGKIALAEKDFNECARITDTVLAWDSNNYDIRLLRARTLVLQDQPTKAIEEFQRLEGLMPKLPEPRYEMAIAHVRNNAFEEAIKKLDEALRLNPDYVDALILRAELKLRTGGADDAVAELAEFTRRHPENGRAHLLLANGYRALGRLDDALTIYQNLIKSFPSVPDFPLLVGVVLRQQNKPDEARNYFEQALRLAPSHTLAAEQLIDLDLARNDFDSAQRRVDQQLKLTTNSAPSLMLQAKVSMAKRDLPGAEAALTRVIEMDPASPAPYSLLASIYISSRNPQKGLAQLQASIKQNPKNPGPLLLMGVIYENLKEFEKAKKAYEDALKLNPKMSAALNNLAYLLVERFNELDQAFQYATKAHEIAPEDSGATDTLGWIHYRRGDFARAMPLLRESAARLSDNAEVQYHLAMTLYTTDNEAAARNAFTNVVRLGPKFAETHAVQRRLSMLDLDASDPKAITLLESALNEDRNDFVAAMKLGQAYERSGANEKARSAFEQAAQINPSAPRPLLYLASLNLDKLKDVPKALEAGRGARKLSPNDPVIAGTLGRVSYRAGDYPAALALLQEYARSDKADAETAYDLALTYYAVGQSGDARANLNGYITASRGSRLPDARNLVALIDFQTGKGDANQVAPIAQARLQQDPNDLPGLVTLGLIAQQEAKYPEAAQRFERVVALNKDFPLALRHLAILYANHIQNDPKAYEFGSKARPGFPNDPDLTMSLGKVSYRRNDFQSAARLLSEGVQQRPTDAEAFYYLGMAYHKLNRRAQAKTELNRAITLKLSPQLESEAKGVLDQLK